MVFRYGVEEVNGADSFASLPSKNLGSPNEIDCRFGMGKKKGFFAPCGVDLWNPLPQDMAEANGINGFKRYLPSLATTLGHNG